MASTSTNKQPLLVDRVFYNSVPTENLASGSDSSLNILGTNASRALVDCTANDGAIVEDIFAISRSSTAYTALLYFSTANDYLRADQSVFVKSITSSTTAGETVYVDDLPKVLAPVPATGNTTGLPDGAPLKNTALYVPRGKALWVTLQLATGIADQTTPIIGVQGGFY